METYGFKVLAFAESTSFINQYQEFNPDVILLDIYLHNSAMNGLEVMRYLRNECHTTSKIIVVSGGANSLQVEEIRNLGAYTFIEKGSNFNLNQLLLTVENAVAMRRSEDANLSLQIENLTLKKQLIKRYPFIGESAAIREAKSQLEKFARADEDIFILGETGTGKEIAAHFYYQFSPRFGNAFHTVNCSALTENLIESELFGHVKGSFTSADKNKTGFFELSDKGILFLDEISNLSMPAQAKILRSIEYKEIQVVGGPIRKVDTRLIFASNEKLETLINKGIFRRDLYYRVEGNVITLPPLRERGTDIILLMGFFFDSYAVKYPVPNRSNLSLIKNELLHYPWPGNIRELRNFCKYLMINEPVLDNRAILKNLSARLTNLNLSSNEAQQRFLEMPSLRESLDSFEQEYLKYHLQKNGWKISETAQSIGIERTTLYKKIKQYRIPKEK
jgi:DNA-binding NtrC family response regulator